MNSLSTIPKQEHEEQEAFPQDTVVGHRIRSVTSSNGNNPLHHEGDEFAFFSNTTSTMNPYNSQLGETTSSPSSLSNTTLPPVLPSQNHEQQQMDATSAALTIGLPLLLFLVFVMCSRGGVPGREHWRGAQIRDTARRIREARIIKKQRKDMTPEERQTQIFSNLWTMTVINKDPRTGYLKLGHQEDIVKEEEEQQDQQQLVTKFDATIKTVKTDDTAEESPVEDDSSDDDLEEDSSDDDDSCNDEDKNTRTGNIFRTKNDESIEKHPDVMLIRSKGSANTADTQDLDVEEGSPTDTQDDEDNVCYICLDNFEVGDAVMWSRQWKSSKCCTNAKNETCKMGCRHVFHQECLMPWLMEKRENECPSCRAPFIVDKIESSKKQRQRSSSQEVNESNDDDTLQVSMGDGSTVPANETSVDDIEAPTVEKAKSVDSDEDLTDDVEEGHSFVIAKGLIQTVPNHVSILAGAVPFR